MILEGNIETTGASCHIRTSYLPQEILFGYRFVPIYPKFTDFEYLFDYAKFDQVEPFQPRLFHLNVAHLNRHLNYVCDTKKEDKNYQITCQNTLQNQDELIAKKSLKSYYQSAKSLRNGAGVVETEADRTGKSFVPIQTILSAFLANSSMNNNSNVADATIMNQPELLNKSVEINVDCADGLPPQANSSINVESSVGKSKNGRFTVVPVASNNANLLITTLAVEEKKDSNRKKFFHKKNLNNQSLNQKHTGMVYGMDSPKPVQNLVEAYHHNHHHRANSLPPIYSASHLETEESEKYQNHHCHYNGVFSETNMAEEGEIKCEEPSNVLDNNKVASFFIDDDDKKEY